MSVTWYTWLEQGRDINPSRQVLDAVSRTLRLGVPEHRYVLGLAGFAPLPAASADEVSTVPAHLQRFLDAIGGKSRLRADPGVGHRRLERRLPTSLPNVATTAPTERNLLWVVFTDPPAVRDLLDDWHVTSSRFLAEFRAEIGSRLGDPALLDLVARLSEASPRIPRRLGTPRYPRLRIARTDLPSPRIRAVTYEHHQLRPSDQPEFQIVVYTPA